jgi:hypothetical protein
MDVLRVKILLDKGGKMKRREKKKREKKKVKSSEA